MLAKNVEHRSSIRLWRVFIYDQESCGEQPITIQGGTYADAERLGNQYIRAWKLQGASITRIEAEEVQA